MPLTDTEHDKHGLHGDGVAAHRPVRGYGQPTQGQQAEQAVDCRKRDTVPRPQFLHRRAHEERVGVDDWRCGRHRGERAVAARVETNECGGGAQQLDGESRKWRIEDPSTDRWCMYTSFSVRTGQVARGL